MATNFADLENTVKSLRAELRAGSKEGGKFLQTLSDSKAVQGLSRFDTGVGQMLFKFRGMVDTLTSVTGKFSGLTKVFNIFSSASAKENKILQDKLGGYKKLIGDFKNIKRAHKEGTVGAMEYANAIKGLKEAGVLDSKGRPTGGFFGKIRALIGAGLKIFKGLLIWGSLVVIAFALLFPIIKDNLPKIKEILPTLKEKFLQFIEIIKPIWEAIKTFVKVLFDPNATWMEKVGAYLKVLWTAVKTVVLDILWPALVALWNNLPVIAMGLWNNVIWPLLSGLWTTIYTYLTTNFLSDLEKVFSYFWEKIGDRGQRMAKGGLIGGAVGTIAGGLAGAAAGTATLTPFGVVAGAFGGAKIGGVAGAGLGTYIGSRATGGPVMGGRPYMVGERGPELFVPNSSGGIVANHRLGNTIHVHVNGRLGASDNELRDIARRVGQMVSKEMNRTTSAGMRMI